MEWVTRLSIKMTSLGFLRLSMVWKLSRETTSPEHSVQDVCHRYPSMCWPADVIKHLLCAEQRQHWLVLTQKNLSQIPSLKYSPECYNCWFLILSLTSLWQNDSEFWEFGSRWTDQTATLSLFYVNDNGLNMGQAFLFYKFFLSFHYITWPH